MNLNYLKKIVSSYKEKEHYFHYRGGRGTDEKFVGTITELFPNVFLIKTNSGRLKCFSYSDFLIKTLKIY